MHRSLALLIAVTAAIGVGVATAEGPQPLVVEVGKIVEVEVGYAMGHLCDDNEILRAEMRNKNADTNVFVVTGVKPGTTLCRAGTVTVEDRPTMLFEITVVAPPAKKPAKKPQRRP